MVRVIGPDVTSPVASLCSTPAVVNFGRYNELPVLPIVTLAVELPVLMFVANAELLFRLITPPDAVIPALKIPRLFHVLIPLTVWLVVKSTQFWVFDPVPPLATGNTLVTSSARSTAEYDGNPDALP